MWPFPRASSDGGQRNDPHGTLGRGSLAAIMGLGSRKTAMTGSWQRPTPSGRKSKIRRGMAKGDCSHFRRLGCTDHHCWRLRQGPDRQRGPPHRRSTASRKSGGENARRSRRHRRSQPHSRSRPGGSSLCRTPVCRLWPASLSRPAAPRAIGRARHHAPHQSNCRRGRSETVRSKSFGAAIAQRCELAAPALKSRPTEAP